MTSEIKLPDRHKCPAGVKIVAYVNGLAAILHVLFWVLALNKLPSPITLTVEAEQSNAAVTYGFGIADLIWSVPLLLVGSFALYRLKPFGWLAAQLANVLYWYSMTVILTRDMYTQSLSIGTVLFLPFTLFAIWAAAYLWHVRETFF